MRPRARLHLPQDVKESLWQHLLRSDDLREQAAFAFVEVASTADAVTLTLVELRCLAHSEFLYQGLAGIELSDETRSEVIKRAHDLECSLVEFHSHPGALPAAFSPSDLAGFREFVPHVWWRLRRRPYAAVVVAEGGFDALVWLDAPDRPVQMEAIVSGSELLRATGNTLKGVSIGRRSI